MDPQMDPRIEIKGRMVQKILNPFIQKGPTDPQTGGLSTQMEIWLETPEIAKRGDKHWRGNIHWLGDANLNLLDEKTKFAIYSLKFRLETAEIWVGLKIGDAHTHRQTDRQKPFQYYMDRFRIPKCQIPSVYIIVPST